MAQVIWYRTEQAAKYLDLKPETLEAWRCRGGGPLFVKLGKAVRYRQQDLDAFLSARVRASTSDEGGK
jgi:excisionase family DNA binding protein